MWGFLAGTGWHVLSSLGVVLALAERAGNDYLPATAQEQTGSGEI
jgi:hypothetical protein